MINHSSCLSYTIAQSMDATPFYTKPACIFGDGCLARLTDDFHDQNYIHSKSILSVCPNEPRCALYQTARSFIINGGEKTKDVRSAQSHASQYYHKPTYHVPSSKGVVIGSRHRPRSLTSNIMIRGESTDQRSDLRSHSEDRNASSVAKSKLSLQELKTLLSLPKESSSSSSRTETGENTPSSGITEIDDKHTVRVSSIRDKISIDIPKLDFNQRNLSRSVPSSPVSNMEFIDTPKMLDTPVEMHNSSPKNGMVKTTPKGHSRRDRKGSMSEKDVISIQTQMGSLSQQILSIKHDIVKINEHIVKFTEDHIEIKKQLSELRDQLIKICLED